MIKEQEKHVISAETLIDSPRWERLETKIIEGSPETFSSSQQRTVFYTLFFALRTEYDALNHDYKENKYTSRSLLAWRARNLLELNMWARFCCEDDVNAKIFFEEAGKDQLELQEKLEQWGKETNQSPEWFDEREKNKQDIHDQAKKHGITKLNSKFYSLLNISKTIGHDKAYKIHNKILSKFAHPTAMLLFSIESEDKLPRTAYYLFSQGCLFFYDGIARIEKFIKVTQK